MEVLESKLTSSQIKIIKKDLRMVIPSEYGPGQSYNIYGYVNGLFTLPLHWANTNFGLKPDEFCPQQIRVGRFLPVLRDWQSECLEICKKEFEKDFGGGVINATTGSGKSIFAMALISETSLKTLIVVHTTELLQQWRKTISLFLPNIKIGIIQGKTFDVEGKDVVIGMLQTISMKANIDSKLFKEFGFGMSIYDEVHLTSCEVFSKVLLKTRTKYTFGLSATVSRKDGMEIVFKYHIGDILYSNVSGAKKQQSIIKPIFYTNPNFKERTLSNGKPNMALMLNDIVTDKTRNKLIVDELRSLRERNVLVLSDRVEHLKYLQKCIGDKQSGLFIGGMKEEDKMVSKEKRILFATYQIASIGFDHPPLNTLVFATPRSSVTQAIGRIYRKIHQVTPLIIDVIDNYGVFPYQYKKRKKIYNLEIELQSGTSNATESSVCLFE
jgi:superfamily II DNA or RNA helicase